MRWRLIGGWGGRKGKERTNTLDAFVFLLLAFELLARGDDGLELWGGGVSWVFVREGEGGGTSLELLVVLC